MKKILITFIVLLIAARPMIASQETEVMAPVRQFFEGFNKSDQKMAQAVCADEIFIIDDFPPHAWSGSRAISKWLHDLNTFEKKHGTSDPSVTLGKPRHLDVTDNHAYVVVPTKLRFKEKGRVVNETGLMTLALTKSAAGWRITAWAWADS